MWNGNKPQFPTKINHSFNLCLDCWQPARRSSPYMAPRKRGNTCTIGQKHDQMNDHSSCGFVTRWPLRTDLSVGFANPTFGVNQPTNHCILTNKTSTPPNNLEKTSPWNYLAPPKILPGDIVLKDLPIHRGTPSVLTIPTKADRPEDGLNMDPACGDSHMWSKGLSPRPLTIQDKKHTVFPSRIANSIAMRALRCRFQRALDKHGDLYYCIFPGNEHSILFYINAASTHLYQSLKHVEHCSFCWSYTTAAIRASISPPTTTIRLSLLWSVVHVQFPKQTSHAPQLCIPVSTMFRFISCFHQFQCLNIRHHLPNQQTNNIPPFSWTCCFGPCLGTLGSLPAAGSCSWQARIGHSPPSCKPRRCPQPHMLQHHKWDAFQWLEGILGEARSAF